MSNYVMFFFLEHSKHKNLHMKKEKKIQEFVVIKGLLAYNARQTEGIQR